MSFIESLRVIRVIHRRRIALDTSWTAIATPIFLAVEARLLDALLLLDCITGLLPMSVHRGFTSVSNERLIIGLTYLSEFVG